MRIRSAAWLFSSQIISLAISFPLSVILARTLGPSGKGSFSLVQLVASTGSILLGLGLGVALSYYAARKEAPGHTAVKLTLGLAVAASTVVAVVLVVGGSTLSGAIFKTSSLTLPMLGAIGVAPMIVVVTLQQFLIGVGWVRRAAFITTSIAAIQLVADLALLARGRLTLGTALAVWVAAMFIAAGWACVSAWPQLRDASDHQPLSLLRMSMSYAMASWAANVVGFLGLRQDQYFVSFFIGTAAVGVYSVATTFAELIWAVPQAINAVMMPKVAAESSDTSELTARLTRTIWPIALGGGIVLVGVAALVIPRIWGLEFTGALLPLALLAPGAAFIATASVPAAYLGGIGHPLDWTISATLNVVANIAANLLLVPRLGIAGAALASTLSYGIASVAVVAFFLRRTRVGPKDLLLPRLDDFAVLVRALIGVLRGGAS